MKAINPSGAYALARAINSVAFDQSIVDRPHLHALVLATRIAINRKTHCLSPEEITLLNDCLVAQPAPLPRTGGSTCKIQPPRTKLRLAYDADNPMAPDLP